MSNVTEIPLNLEIKPSAGRHASSASTTGVGLQVELHDPPIGLACTRIDIQKLHDSYFDSSHWEKL